MLRLLVEDDVAGARGRIDGMVTGRVVAFGDGCPVVSFPGGPPGGVPARTLVDVSERDAGREVALMFDGGSPARPVVMGLVRPPAPGGATASAPAPTAAEPPPTSSAAPLLSVSVDGDAVVLAAEREIVLRCGKASLTLTRDGHVVLRGEYILSRAAGVNRIKGGSVQIN
ncbi:hypothetical protein BE11_47510 [Sorangium cellulosum]|nr:hypothetical protein BE11_47510 [Sorangium cellulosum]